MLTPQDSSDYLARSRRAGHDPRGGHDQATAHTCSPSQDIIHEHDETLKVVITGATGARLGTVIEAVGTITNDDSPPVVGFVGDVTADEDASVPLNPPFDIDGDGIA